MEDFFDNIVKHNCQKIFPPDCTEVFIVEKPRRGRNFARFSPLAFAAQKLPRTLLPFASHPPAPQKRRNPYRIAFFFKWRDGLRVELDCVALALSGFCVAKIPFASHPPAPQKTQPLSDCVFFKWRDGLRVELDCAALALSGFCVAKIPFASHLSAPQKTQPFRIAFSSKWRDGRDSNSRPPA